MARNMMLLAGLALLLWGAAKTQPGLTLAGATVQAAAFVWF